jgi:hypothetical protein
LAVEKLCECSHSDQGNNGEDGRVSDGKCRAEDAAASQSPSSEDLPEDGYADTRSGKKQTRVDCES